MVEFDPPSPVLWVDLVFGRVRISGWHAGPQPLRPRSAGQPRSVRPHEAARAHLGPARSTHAAYHVLLEQGLRHVLLIPPTGPTQRQSLVPDLSQGRQVQATHWPQERLKYAG